MCVELRIYVILCWFVFVVVVVGGGGGSSGGGCVFSFGVWFWLFDVGLFVLLLLLFGGVVVASLFVC